MKKQHGYLAFYNGNQTEIYAPSLYEAKQAAIKKLKVPKRQEHMVAVLLARLDGVDVVHCTSVLPV